MEGLNWQTVQLPLAAGLDQQADDRALQLPSLLIAKDVHFDEGGGVQTRHPFAALGSNIFGGGTISGARRLVDYGDERVMFTEDALYTWSAGQSKWVSRGTHLAIAVDEAPVFTTTGDQRTCDRASLSGTVVYAFVDADGLWVAAADASNGSTLMAPTLANSVGTRPRLVALSTRILLFWVDTAANDLECIAIDPASPATAVAGAATTVLAASGSYYDVVKIPSANTAIGGCRRAVTTSYELFTVTAGLTVANSTKARTCDGPIAVSCEPTGTSVQVVRANGTAIQGDLIDIAGLADAATGQALGTATGTPINQIAAAHRSTTDGGFYRCYLFYSSQESTGTTGFDAEVNYVDTNGTIGTESRLVYRLGVASRAFDYDGHVYVWMAFGGESQSAGMGEPLGIRAQLQNTYFLYRDDGTGPYARCVWQRGGGFSPVTGYLPGVQLASGSTGFAWCGTERRVVPLSDEPSPTAKRSGYADRGPVDVTFTFDDDRARRCVQLGRTLYVTGSLVLQYDGEGLTECGFLVYPWYFGAVQSGAGAIPDGTYSYKSTLGWENARSERERSTTATGETITVSGGPGKVDFAIAPLHVTLKQGTRRPPAIEIWRTEANPPTDAPFYLDTSNDPGVTSGDNRYIPNAPSSAFASDGLDNYDDDTLSSKETNPENGGILENLAPPPATIIAAHGSRLFLGGVAGEPRRVWYSKLRSEGEVAAFHDTLTVGLPPDGGDMVALGFLDGVLVAFCESAIYMLPGDGFDNVGQGSNYGPARAVSYDVGCRDHDSVATTPMGLVFHSAKGKYLLNRGFSLTYIGGPVSDYDSETVLACHVDEKRHHVRWLTASRMLVWDYKADAQDGQGQWAEWTVADGVHAAVMDGTYYYLTSTGPKSLSTSYTSLTYGLDVETAWIKPADLQGFVRVRHMTLLGEYRSAHKLRVRVYYDYNATAVDDKTWTPSPTTVGGPLQVRIFPSRQKAQAIKLRITAVDATNTANPPSGEALKLTGLALELGMKRGTYRRLPAAQRT